MVGVNQGLLEDLLGGKNPQAMLGGERMAALMQAAQFAAGCHPKVFPDITEDTEKLQSTLDHIHSAGGLVVSVTQTPRGSYTIVAYMPKEK